MTGHCRHCLGNCNGTCLLRGGNGLCIHNPLPRQSLRANPRLVLSRRFWRRILWGVHPG
jgi:hypothetical protein